MSDAQEGFKGSRETFLKQSRVLGAYGTELDHSVIEDTGPSERDGRIFMDECSSFVDKCSKFVIDWRTSGQSLTSLRHSFKSMHKLIRNYSKEHMGLRTNLLESLSHLGEDALDLHIHNLETQMHETLKSIRNQDAEIHRMGSQHDHPAIVVATTYYGKPRSVHPQLAAASLIATECRNLLTTGISSRSKSDRGLTASQHVTILRNLRAEGETSLGEMRALLSPWAEEGTNSVYAAQVMLDGVNHEEKDLDNLYGLLQELNTAQHYVRLLH